MKRFLTLILFTVITTCQLFAQDAEWTMLHQGNRAFQRGDWAKAEKCYRKALEANPRSSRAMFNLGDAFLAQKNGKDALDYYVKAAKAEGNKAVKAMAYHNIGFIHHNNHDYDKAIEAYKEALRNNPRDADTRYNLALAQKMKLQQPQSDNQKQDQKNNSDSGSNQQQDDEQNQQNQQNQQQMSEDNIEQLMNLAKQAEQQTRKKIEKAQQPVRKQLNKNW